MTGIHFPGNVTFSPKSDKMLEYFYEAKVAQSFYDRRVFIAEGRQGFVHIVK